MNIAKLLLIATVVLFFIASCDSDDGVAEKAGKAVEKTTDQIGQAATDVGNAIEDACEKAKKNAGAADTNC